MTYTAQISKIKSEHAFRWKIYRAYVSYIETDHEYQFSDFYSPMYFFIKHDLNLPLPPWIETKILVETHYTKYLSMVSDRELEIAKGENELSINIFDELGDMTEFADHVLKKWKIENFSERHAIIWSRVCLKNWFLQFGVDTYKAKLALDIHDTRDLAPRHRELDRLIRKRMSAKEIAGAMDCSLADVLNHVAKAYQKPTGRAESTFAA